jgi:TRAP transporter TAXI family solute receptor
MNALKELPGRLARLYRNPRLVAILAVSFILLTVVLLVLGLRTPTYDLTMSAGASEGRRNQIAERLRDECARRGVNITIEETFGSEEALAEVGKGDLDVALVQGGLEAPRSVREVAPLMLEMLHLLVHPEVPIFKLEDLRVRRVNLSTRGSGTHTLALEILALAGLEPERDFQESNLTYEELLELPRQRLPDAVFHVSSLPSPVADYLVDRHGYRVIDVPVAQALALRNPSVREATIPAYAYGPAVPAAPVSTVGTRMLFVAHESVDPQATRRLVEAVYSDRFERSAVLPVHDGESLLQHPEYELHDGTIEYLRRHERLLTPETIDNLESLRSFFVSFVVALFLAWRWFRARQLQGFDDYIKQVNELEKKIMRLERRAALDIEELLASRRQLQRIKVRGLEAYAAGKMASAELLSSFLLHVNDVRDQVDDLLLHARERLEKKARRTGAVEDEDALVEKLWGAARADAGEDDSTIG